MADPINDAYLNQLFPGEFCIISIGSRSIATGSIVLLGSPHDHDYSAFITNFSRTGFNQTYTNERTMGTFLTSREGISPGEVSFDVVFVG